MKRYLAECAGTFCLVFCGTGSVIVHHRTHGLLGQGGISAAFGLIVIAMIYAFGKTSGAHINPAVSIGFAIAGLFPRKQLIPYILAQCAGAIIASLTLKLLFPADETLGATIPSGSAWQSFLLEIILTFILMLVILKTATGSKESSTVAGIAIGSVIFVEALFAGPISGASMNPARSLGPAFVSGHVSQLWIYLTAPVFGAGLASMLHKRKS
jgi:aquaporin Z